MVGVPLLPEFILMMYLASDDAGAMATVRRVDGPGSDPDPVPSTGDQLTALERLVVVIARADGRSSLRKPGWMSTAIRALSGRRNPMLADKRLEALRRIAVLTWHQGDTVPPNEVRTFLDAGFTPGQHDIVQSACMGTSFASQF